MTVRKIKSISHASFFAADTADAIGSQLVEAAQRSRLRGQRPQ